MQDENNNIVIEPQVEYEDVNGNSVMEKPFDPTLIKIETKTPSLDTLIKRIKSKSVQLNTETYFQRKDDLWDKTKQSRLIESILIRFPLPAFFFDATDDNSWLVVDGLQRLSSIRNFVVDKSQPLTNLEFLTHLNGSYWDELPENLQRLIEEAQVVIYKILPGTPIDVKFNIFKRINTGGLVLEPQEIRHALFQGKPAAFMYELANSEEFKKVTENKIASNRMLDRDFVNRFLAFYLLGVEKYGTKEFGLDLDSFMSNAMAALYTKTDIELSKIKLDFNNAMKLAKSIFNKEAFRKVRGNYEKLPPINKAIFDCIATQFALLDDEESAKLLTNGKLFKELLSKELATNNDFFMSVSNATGDKGRATLRHSKVKELILKAIKD
ncbi:MAG: DUF262 domain-containing protein [Bacteroidetes bacterium]|nr:DUF262 domain-containing protein [Bacteroidota bacterium]